MTFDTQVSLDTLIAAASLLAGFFLLWLQSRKEQSIQVREIYQRLELASIDMFRYEAENPTVTATFWSLEDIETDDADMEYKLEAHATQLLNLFEIALRARREGTVPADVFGSWVIWLWSLCCAPTFRRIWHEEELGLNYVEDLERLIVHGLSLQNKKDGVGRKAFFNFVATELDCPEVARWLSRATPSGGSHAAT